MKPWIAPLFCLISTTVTAAPDAFQATYSVSVKGFEVGQMTAKLQYTNGSYTYEKLTKPNALAAFFSDDTLLERSNGQRDGDKLIPSSYLHHHQSKRKERQDDFSFITPTQVKGTYDSTAYELNVPAGTLDMATLELYLMEALQDTKPLHYQVVARGKLQDYRLNKVGKETLALPAGNYECEKVEVQHSDKERQT
ncbi:MAG: DUF3108 domain-containing protein, partial [Thiothrix sp.]